MPTATAVSEEDLRLNQLIQLTNEYREKNGLPQLKVNNRLSAAAQTYAERMAKEGFFDHVAPDGRTIADRINASGYSYLVCGENIAEGYNSPEEVMKAWIESPSHRENLLFPKFQEIGVGYAIGSSTESGDRYPYWVQEFGERESTEAPR